MKQPAKSPGDFPSDKQQPLTSPAPSSSGLCSAVGCCENLHGICHHTRVWVPGSSLNAYNPEQAKRAKPQFPHLQNRNNNSHAGHVVVVKISDMSKGSMNETYPKLVMQVLTNYY